MRPRPATLNRLATSLADKAQPAENPPREGCTGDGTQIYSLQARRDLWRQTNLPDVDAATGTLKMTIPVHGVVLYKLTQVK